MKFAWLAALAALSLNAPALAADTPSAGSGNFCLFALPPDGTTTRWVNLGIVQYVEVRPENVVITYGGGNLGAGYEARIPVKTREEASAVLSRLRQSAEECARPAGPRQP